MNTLWMMIVLMQWWNLLHQSSLEKHKRVQYIQHELILQYMNCIIHDDCIDAMVEPTPSIQFIGR